MPGCRGSREERFWAKVDKGPHPNGCWLWNASLSSSGYGQLAAPRRGARPRGAHIISWELHHGPVPDGLCVLHKCDVRRCVNPDHLFTGTRGDNGRDMAEKKRSPYGTSRWNAKLTDAEIPRIRALSRHGVPQRQIGEIFGVAQYTISAIVTGKTWGHVR